jgi:serine/threonine-protein kinase
MADRAPDPSTPLDVTILPKREASDASASQGTAEFAALDAEVHREAYSRIAWVGLSYALAYSFAFFGTWAIDASLLDDTPPDRFNIVIAILSILAGFFVFVASRRRLIPVSRLESFAIAVEIAGAFGINLGAWGWEQDIAPTEQIMGIPWVCVWILIFPTLIPAAPRKTLVAALIAAASGPIVMAISVVAHGIPVGTSAGDVAGFIVSMGYPAFIAAWLSHSTALLFRRLSREAARARQLGSYQLVERIGAGGMGEVWKAKHRLLARPAAIKLIRPKALGPDPGSRRTLVKRFEREAQATAALNSPHTIELYDFGVTDDGDFYYVMELLDGMDLKTLVERHGPLPEERVVHILRQVCHSLHDAHLSGMVHRDVKPANIFACRRGQELDFVKVLDFGLVAAGAQTDSAGTQLTREGILTGTPAFMAPEMIQGDRPVDALVDIYALGCVGYWLLTGQLVFDAASPMAVLLMHAKETPSPPSARTGAVIHPDLERIILDCLAKDPVERPASARALATRLARCAEIIEPWSEERAAEWWASYAPASRSALLTESTLGLSR